MFAYYLVLWLSLPRFVRTFIIFLFWFSVIAGICSQALSSFSLRDDLPGVLALTALVSFYFYLKKKLLQFFRERKARKARNL